MLRSIRERVYATRRGDRGVRSRLAATVPATVAALMLLGLAGCGGEAPDYIGAVDGTFSDHRVADKCLGDVGRAVEKAAEQGGSFAFFAYDGDPLSRRGVAVDFGALPIPNRIKGTSKEDEYRVEQAGPVQEKMKKMAAVQPDQGGTPLRGVLTRIARIAEGGGGAPKRAVNCGDGLWTDLRPGMSRRQLRDLAESVPSGLEGMTVDFIGLAASTPGSGRWVERLRPLVREVLRIKHAQLGVYDIELPAGWPEAT